jgi:Flp pilus assembly protein TadG
MKALRRKTRRGSSLVEFAIAWPVLSLLFFGVIDYARLMGIYGSLNGAARSGAQQIIDDVPTFALAASSSDATSWNTLVSQVQTAAALNTTASGLSTTVTKAFACPTGDGGEAALQSAIPSCTNYRIYVRVKTTVPVSAWAPVPKVIFPTSLSGTAMVRVK